MLQILLTSLPLYVGFQLVNKSRISYRESRPIGDNINTDQADTVKRNVRVAMVTWSGTDKLKISLSFYFTTSL